METFVFDQIEFPWRFEWTVLALEEGPGTMFGYLMGLQLGEDRKTFATVFANISGGKNVKEVFDFFLYRSR